MIAKLVLTNLFIMIFCGICIRFLNVRAKISLYRWLEQKRNTWTYHSLGLWIIFTGLSVFVLIIYFIWNSF